MECVREAVCCLRWKEKVSDKYVMEKAMRMGEKGHARWQMKPLYDATHTGAIAWVRAGYLKELRNEGQLLQRRQDVHPQHFLTLEEVRKQALFNVTYRWLSPGHPDPDGFHLARLVDVLTNDKADDDDGVFLYFSSLYQWPRTEHQERLFEEGHKAQKHLSSNFRVGCIVLSELPEESSAASFWESGWCYVDFLMSTVANELSMQRIHPSANT